MEFKKTTRRLKRECEVNNTEKQRRGDKERGRDKGFLLKQSEEGKEGGNQLRKKN